MADDLSETSELSVTVVYDPELVAACQADLERLLPLWLSLEPEEQQWRLQRFLDKLTAQPELQPTYLAVLQQRINAHDRFGAAEPGIELIKEIKQSLDLMPHADGL